ncbi:MAG: protein phosphatase 2C domain-containing protein [Cyanosarcina radialis HA8281-LM2]|jgi:hypothetical protein|nr:protein phosphatase 2C domain-containing protein [Cyanosarcina radialis HA8281-LM2]
MWEIAGGSVTGRDRLRFGKNNQDAFSWAIAKSGAIVAVVGDGCGSKTHSEVGAKIGVELVTAAIVRQLEGDGEMGRWGDGEMGKQGKQGKQGRVFNSTLHAQNSTLSIDWQQVQQEVLMQLQSLAKAMGGDFAETVQNYFLFTIVGALVTSASATIFAIGDGVAIANGKPIQLGPFPGNAPPYLAYGLFVPSPPSPLPSLGEGCPIERGEGWQFQIHQQLSIDEVESILIGTDGVSNLIEVADRLLPGKSEPVGEVSQFWEDDRYFKNPDAIRRQLSLINREVTKPDWQGHQLVKEVGFLPDDTTLVAMRRSKK